MIATPALSSPPMYMFDFLRSYDCAFLRVIYNLFRNPAQFLPGYNVFVPFYGVFVRVARSTVFDSHVVSPGFLRLRVVLSGLYSFSVP